MDDTSRTRDALPWPEPRGDALAALILHEHIEIALQHEEALLDLTGMRGIALAGRHEHDREREVPGRDHSRIIVLAGTAGADETMLGALVTLDLGVLEGGPVGLFLAKPPDMSCHDLFDRNAFELGRPWMPCNAHGAAPSKNRDFLGSNSSHGGPDVNEPDSTPKYHRRTRKQRRMAEFCRTDVGNFAAAAPLLSWSKRVWDISA